MPFGANSIVGILMCNLLQNNLIFVYVKRIVKLNRWPCETANRGNGDRFFSGLAG